MQSKKLGKYSLGFVDDLKAKGKERGAVGAAKVCLIASKASRSQFDLNRLYVLLRAETLDLQARQLARYKCGICNLV